jgi:hypothetical protein
MTLKLNVTKKKRQDKNKFYVLTGNVFQLNVCFSSNVGATTEALWHFV